MSGASSSASARASSDRQERGYDPLLGQLRRISRAVRAPIDLVDAPAEVRAKLHARGPHLLTRQLQTSMQHPSSMFRVELRAEEPDPEEEHTFS